MQHQHHHQHHHQQRRHTLAHRSTRSTRSSISNNNNDYDYHPLLLASSVLSPAAQVAVARGRSLPTTTTAPAPAAPTPTAIPPRPAATPAAAAPASNSPALPPLQLQLQLQSLLLPPKLRPYPLTNPLALRDCVPDAHPDDANDPYLVAAYACLRVHHNKAMTLDAISAWCHRNHLLSRSQESEPHLRDHLRSHLSRHPDRRNALFTWFPLTANHAHLKDALHNPALVLTSRTTHVWYISRAGRAQCPFARLGLIINNNNTTSQFSKRKSPPQGAASVTADANRSTKFRITLRLPPKSLFPSRPRPRPRPRTRPRPSLLSSQAPSHLFPHGHLSDPHRHHHPLNQDDHNHDQDEDEDEDENHDGDDGDNDDDDDDNDDDNDDDDDDDDDDSASDTDYSSDDDDDGLLHHSIISPVGPISIPTFRPAHDPLSIHVLCPFALDSNPPPDSEDEADDFHNSMLRQDIQSDSEFSIKHEFIPVDLPPIIDVNVKQHLGTLCTALPTDIPLHEWHHQHQYDPLSLPIAPTHHAAVLADDASATIKEDDESHALDAWSALGSEREQSVASTAAFPVPFSPPSTSTEDTMSPSPTPPSDCGDAPTPAVKTEEESASLPLSVPVPVPAPAPSEEEEVFPIDGINPLEVEASPSAAAAPAVPESHPHWEDGPICGPESVSPDDVDIFWGAGKHPTPAESSKMATERAIRAGRTRLHLHTSQQALTLRRFSNANSEPPARVDRMCSMSSVAASDWTADDSECALLTPAHTGWKMSSNWKHWPLERQTTAVKFPENKVKPELPIKVEPKEDELAIPASDKLKRLLTNSAFSANLHKANCPTIQTRILLGVPVFQCLILYPQVTLIRRMDTDWVNVTTLMQYCSYVTSKAQDGRLPPPPGRADLPPQAVYVESSSPLIHGAWAPLGIARSVARAHDTVPWIKRTFLGDALAGKFAASAVTEAKACLAHEVPAGAGIGAQFARPSVLSADELKPPPRAPPGIRSAHSIGTVPLTPLDLLPKAELFASFNNPPSTPVSKSTILPRSMVAPLGATGEATFPHCVQIKGEHLGPDLIAEPLKPEEEELLREILVTSPAKKEVGRNEEKMEEEEEVELGEDAMEVDEEQEEEEEEEEEEESVPAQSTRSKTRAALPAPMTRSRRAASPVSTCSSLSDSDSIPNPVPVRKVGRPSKATIAERKAAKEKAKAEKGAESDDESAQPRRSSRMQAKVAAAAASKAEAKKKASKARAAPAPRQSLSTVPHPTKSVSGRSLRAIARSRA